MQTLERQAVRAERLGDFKKSGEYLASQRLDPRADDETISTQAIVCISNVRAHVQAFGRTENGPETVQFLRGTLNGIAHKFGVPPVAEKVNLAGCIGRMIDPAFWRRNLRKQLLKENENIEHAAGAVRRRGQCYVTDHAVHRKAARAKINRATLESMEVVNEEGLALNLQEVADKSVSNPALRRAELMTRCRGFEDTAKYMGHTGLFLTLTCPSRFHKFTGGVVNKKWHGATPKDGQKYLCGVWKKIRAAWHRAGFFPYGFRVAEPHHDGCPHWHILLFVAPEDAGYFDASRLLAGRSDHGAGIVGTAGKYALQDSPAEAGAVKHRFTCKRIDPAQGSATGYIAKYISKNIDGLNTSGESVGLDYASGTPAEKGAARVKTWAQVHSIRQFQQIGGPSVTVWREIRKVKTQQQNDLFEMPRAAADTGLWSLFWVLQGGPEVPRKELTLKPAYVSDNLGKYGDEVSRVWGVEALDGCAMQTRAHNWTIQRAGKADVDLHCAVVIDEIAAQKRLDTWARAAGFASASDFEAVNEVDCPWTRVNNCTENEKETGQKSDEQLDFERGAALIFAKGGGTPPFERSENEKITYQHRTFGPNEGSHVGQ